MDTGAGCTCRIRFVDGTCGNGSLDGTHGREWRSIVPYVKQIPRRIVRNVGCHLGEELYGGLESLSSPAARTIRFLCRQRGSGNPCCRVAGRRIRKSFGRHLGAFAQHPEGRGLALRVHDIQIRFRRFKQFILAHLLRWQARRRADGLGDHGSTEGADGRADGRRGVAGIVFELESGRPVRGAFSLEPCPVGGRGRVFSAAASVVRRAGTRWVLVPSGHDGAEKLREGGRVGFDEFERGLLYARICG